MKYVEVVTDAGSSDTILALAEKAEARDTRLGVVGEDGKRQIRLLVVRRQNNSHSFSHLTMCGFGCILAFKEVSHESRTEPFRI
jgi:hypothetical protein